MNERTRHLFDAALESLGADIKDSFARQRFVEGVPCQNGVKAFQRDVTLYWDLRERLHSGDKKAYRRDEPMPEEVCDSMPMSGEGRL